jgi:hypothetical protein
MSKDKNVENKNEGVGRGTRVRVRAREVSPSIYFHFQHFYLSTYVPFLFSTFIFSTFLLSTKVGGIKDNNPCCKSSETKCLFIFRSLKRQK